MTAAPLNPRHLLELLAPAIRLDEEVVGDYVLGDCYRLDPSSPLQLELHRRGRPRERVGIEVAPLSDEGHPMPTTVAGLGLSYRAPAPAELGLAACRILGEALAARLGEAARAWELSPPSVVTLAEAIVAEVRASPATLEREPDRALLALDFDYYEGLYGARPELAQVEVLGVAVVGPSVHYPAPKNGRVPNSAALYPAATRIAHRRRMRRYFAELGCVFDDEAIPRTVPTPQTYARVLADRPGLARVRPRMVTNPAPSLGPVRWGLYLRRHLLPVSVAPAWAVELHRRVRDVELFANIPCDVGMTVHDMGLHALALHAMPAAAWDSLVAAALARVRARPWVLLAGRFGLLARLASFFEGPVTTHCWEAWREADEPEDFEASFAPHFDALISELRGL